MTDEDRRPHWGDALVYAVIHEIGVLRPSPPPLANTAYAVIAAVEDWQAQHARDKVLMVAGNPGTYVGGLEAAIQRVRELHRPSQSTIWSHDLQQAITVTTCHCGSEQYPCPTIKAMDGDSDD